MGLTKCTLFGIVLFKFKFLFFHVFFRSLVLILPVPHVRGVYKGSFFSIVLILCIPAYLGIKGDQFISDFGIFFGGHFTCKLVYYNLYYMSDFTQN